MTTFLSQGIDYLGFLDAKLRDLQGYATLAHELIQNADDAEATCMSFDVCNEALIAENNSTFSDCGQVEADECPWKDISVKGHRCDFHRFRKVAGGDKREQETTTGAFGIGFISVYQITDKPELLSGRRHWIIRPEAEEQQRIEQIDITSSPYVGTRFILPWATNPQSVLRRRLRTQTVQVEQGSRTLIEVLSQALPNAILFLKHLTRIELRRNGQLIKAIERIDDRDQVVVQDGDEMHLWRLLRGSFDAEAAVLRSRFPTQIETKRTATITVAIAESAADLNGLFCACLPTKQHTELPFHINADFYTSTDRKRILLSDDHQGAWNRAAIREAANLVAKAIPHLPHMIGAVALWDLFARLKAVHDQATSGQIDTVFAEFWNRAQPSIQTARVVATWPDRWHTLAETYLLERQEEETALPLFEQIGLHLVHPDLRRYYSLLLVVGVRRFGLLDLAQALKAAGLSEAVDLEEAPVWIQSAESRELLSREIEILSEQRVKHETAEIARREIRESAIALAHDGWLCAPATLYNPAPEIVTTFVALDLEEILLSEANPTCIAALAEKLRPSEMLRVLEAVPRERLESLWREQKPLLLGLIDWFIGQGKAVLSDVKLKARLRALPIWPSGNSLYPLDNLYVSGTFDDPLQLASLLDGDVRRDRHDFLRELGNKWLTLQTYAHEFIPRAFETKLSIEPTKRRQLIVMLAEHLGELRDSADTRRALARCPLVDCQDDIFRTASDVYFDTPAVSEGLGPVPLAREATERPEAVRDFYAWLGVASEPRLPGVIERIEAIVAGAPTKDQRQAIANIVRYLSSREIAPNDPDIRPLSTRRWLPARGDDSRWYAPAEIYAVYQEYLFSTQARFLDFDQPLQNRANRLFELLGIQSRPSVLQVVNHLRHCAALARPVNLQVYRYLNEQVDDPAIEQLRGKACLLLESGQYVIPTHVFWGEHSFGRYRYRLNPELRAYSRLFTRLGVRESPKPADAIQVMQEIAEAFERSNASLDDEAYNVLIACWRQLNDALDRDEIMHTHLAQLQDIPVVPTDNRLLRPPAEMFLDDRPGLTDRFRNFKEQHAIARILGAWRAMEAAGVQPLSKSVKITLVECEDREPADDLTSRIRDRRTLIARVIEALQINDEQPLDLSLFDRLHIERVSRLAIDYGIRVGDRAWVSEPEDVAAYLHDPHEVIYVQRHQSGRQWPALARELAFALSPQGDAVQLATGLKEVLSAETPQDAAEALSELGYAQLVIFDTVSISQGPVGLGAISNTTDAEVQPTAPPVGAAPTPGVQGSDGSSTGTSVSPGANGTIQSGDATDRESAASTAASPGTSNGTGSAGPNNTSNGTGDTGSTSDTTNTGTTNSSNGVGSSGGTSAPNGSDAAETGSGAKEAAGPGSTSGANGTGGRNGVGPKSGTSGNGTSSGADGRSAFDESDSTQRKRGRLRTYVAPAKEGVAGDGTEAATGNSAIDRAGVDRVLQYERKAGRDPREMPHQNPGYDIESCDITGSVVRYIEVKSVAGYWDSQGVGLSSTQFRSGHLYGDEYWLYVVERAERADAQIYRIQDPARRVDQFFYDDGWRALAESNQTTNTKESYSLSDNVLDSVSCCCAPERYPESNSFSESL